MKALMIWFLVASFHPVDHPRDLGMFASKTVCEQVGKIQQRESDKINRGRRDGRGTVFQDGHSMSYECLSQKDWDSGLDPYEPKPPESDPTKGAHPPCKPWARP